MSLWKLGVKSDLLPMVYKMNEESSTVQPEPDKNVSENDKHNELKGILSHMEDQTMKTYDRMAIIDTRLNGTDKTMVELLKMATKLGIFRLKVPLLTRNCFKVYGISLQNFYPSQFHKIRLAFLFKAIKGVPGHKK